MNELINKKIIRRILFTGFSILSFVIFYFTREKMLLGLNLFRGVDSDGAIYALMADEIFLGQRIPIFFYGQNYMGPLTSILMGPVQGIINLFGINQGVPSFGIDYLISPKASAWTTFLMVYTGFVFFALGIKKYFNLLASLVFLILSSLGNSLLMQNSLRPNGPEMVIFLTGLIFCFSYYLKRSPTFKNQFLFGFLFGFSWWMNQTVVFILVPIIIILISDHPYYASFRKGLKLLDRIFLKFCHLELRPLHKNLQRFFYLLHFGLLVNFLLGLYITYHGGLRGSYFGVRINMGNGFSQIKSTILIFSILHFLLYLSHHQGAKSHILKLVDVLKYWLCGVFLGYFPVLFGRFFGWYEKSYKPKIQLVAFKDLDLVIKKFIYKFLPNLYYKGSHIGFFMFSILFLLTLFLLYKSRDKIQYYLFFKSGKKSILSLFPMVIILNFLYVFWSHRAFTESATRYGIIALIATIGFISILPFYLGIKSKKIQVLISLPLVFSFGHVFYKGGQSYLGQIARDDLPLKNMKALKESGCQIIYANYWQAYKYEFLSQHQLKFIVYNSQERTPHWTKLREKESDKCLWTKDYKIVKSFSP